MTKFVSRRGTLGIAVESVRGTPVTPTYWLPWAKLSFFDKINSAMEEQGMGQIADQDSFYVTMTMAEGDVDAQLYDKGLGFILSSLLGARPSTAGSDPYTHTFTLSQSNQAQSLSLYWKDPNYSLMFPLAIAESLKITIAPSGLVEYSIHFKSKKSRTWASLSPDFTSVGNKFTHQDSRLKFASNIAGLGAATTLSLKNFELNISRSTIFDEVIGTAEPEDVLSQQLTIEGSVTLNHEDDTLRAYMLNNTYRAMEFALVKSASSSLTMQFPRMSFSEWEPDLTLNEIAKQKINFKANYDAVNGLDSISTCTLINSLASY